MNFKRLYTLQFDHEASFIVEGICKDDSKLADIMTGLEVQSHSPYHELNPLPIEMRRLEDTERRTTRDSLTYVEPFDCSNVIQL